MSDIRSDAPSPLHLADEETIERVARGICRAAHIDAYGDSPWRQGELDLKVDRLWPKWKGDARAAIEAMRDDTHEPSAAAHGTARALSNSNTTELIAELEPDWAVSKDGPHAISDQRRWLARKLMDSKLTDEEAFGIVAFHPNISDEYSKARGAAR